MRRWWCVVALLVAFGAAASAADAVPFATYADFKDYCLRRASALAQDELNRALAEVKLLHGEPTLAGMTALQVAAELKKQGYYKPRIPYRFSWDPLELTKGAFRSAKYGVLKPEEYPLTVELSKQFLKQALVDADFVARLFALDWLGPRRDLTPVEFVLHGFLRESEPALAGRYFALLANERYVKAAVVKVKALGPLDVARVKALDAAAATRQQKAQALFLAVMYTDWRPAVEVPTLVQCFDDGYAVPFLVKLFKAYPGTWLQEFIVPYVEGYGDKQPQILAVFERFPEDKKILGALQRSFEGRHDGHFGMMQGQIVEACERLTGLSYAGDDKPFLDWFKAQGAVEPAPAKD